MNKEKMFRIRLKKIMIFGCCVFAVLLVQSQTFSADEKPRVTTPEKAYAKFRKIKDAQHGIWIRTIPPKKEFETTAEYENRIRPIKETQKHDSERAAEKLTKFLSHTYDIRIGRVGLKHSIYDADNQVWDFINIRVSGEIYPFRARYKDKIDFLTYGLNNGNNYPASTRTGSFRIEQQSGHCNITIARHSMTVKDAKTLYKLLESGKAELSILGMFDSYFYMLPKQIRLISKGRPIFYWDTASEIMR